MIWSWEAPRKYLLEMKAVSTAVCYSWTTGVEPFDHAIADVGPKNARHGVLRLKGNKAMPKDRGMLE